MAKDPTQPPIEKCTVQSASTTPSYPMTFSVEPPTPLSPVIGGIVGKFFKLMYPYYMHAAQCARGRSQ